VAKASKKTATEGSSVASKHNNKILILESPNKIASVKKYLGSDWTVLATVGHIVELPPGKDAIDTKTWDTKFEVIASKQQVVDSLKNAVKHATEVYLATDPDREGEAIAWFVYEQTKSANPKAKFYRASFNAITKDAVTKAIANKTTINLDLVNSQRTRVILDRVVGYTVSPIVQRHVRKAEKHHAAGRVMSVALKILAERQKEINAFKPEEFWDIFLNARIDNIPITLQLIQKSGKALKVTNQKDAIKIKEEIFKAGNSIISEIKEKETKRIPKPPLTTVSLQQLASSKLGFQVKKTMEVAQELFSKGFISYHRSDSVRLEPEEIKKAQTELMASLGKKYIASPAIEYKTKSRTKVQDAHTAIQPTDASRTKVEGDAQAQKLYDLIRKRFLACQSVPAEFKIKTLSTDIGLYTFKATASTLIFDGYLKVMGHDDDSEDNDEGLAALPDVKKGAIVEVKDVETKQKFTIPPSHFNDATLVKTLEANGVGRPSTYASVIDKLLLRNYMERDKKKLVATDIGCVVSDFLTKEFSEIFNIKFTSEMEDILDEIEDGKKPWKDVLDKFWQELTLKIKQANLTKARLEETGKICHLCKGRVLKSIGGYHGIAFVCENKDCNARFDKLTGAPVIVKTVGQCPKCGKEVVEREGKHGLFYACSGYPACKTICSLDDGKLVAPEETKSGECVKCGANVVEKKGRFGTFLACSGYPKCKTIYEKDENGELVEKGGSGAASKGVGTCPKCKSDIVEKTGRYGAFFSCSGYPKCKTIFEKNGDTFVEKTGGATTESPKSTAKPKTKKAATKKKKSNDEAPF